MLAFTADRLHVEVVARRSGRSPQMLETLCASVLRPGKMGRPTASIDLPPSETDLYALRSSRPLRGDFRLVRDEKEVAKVGYTASWDRARFEKDGLTYRCAPGGLIGWTFRLRAGEETLAVGRRNLSLRRFEVEAFGRAYCMESRTRGWTPFVVLEHESGREVGRLEREDARGREAVVQLPASMPLPLQVFFCYLGVVSWRRVSGALLSFIRPV